MRTRGVWRKVGGRIGGRALKLRGGLAEQRLKKKKSTRPIVFGGTVACWAGTRVAMLNKWTSGLEIHTLANARCLPGVQRFALIALVHCAPRTRVATQSK